MTLVLADTFFFLLRKREAEKIKQFFISFLEKNNNDIKGKTTC